MELTKKDKGAARQIIEAGLQREFAKGLQEADAVLQDWKEKLEDNREAYHTLFKTVRDFDKHIARRYDRMTGSNYLFIIAAQIQDGIITEADLTDLSEAAQQRIMDICS